MKSDSRKYVCGVLGKEFQLQEPNLEKIKELEKLGFDFADVLKVNHAYLKCTSKPVELKKLFQILFGVKLKDDEIKKIYIKVVRDGIMDFLYNYGLILK